MRRLTKVLLVVLVLGTVGSVGVLWTRAAPDRRDDAFRNAQTVRAVRRDVAAIVKATGIVKPMVGAEVKVGSRVSGVVQRLFVRVGAPVARGQVLAELDVRDLAAKRDEAAAAVALAEANLRYADTDLRRKRELRAAELLAPSEVDVADQAFSVAVQRRAQARASLDYAATQLAYARIVAPIAGIVSSVSTQEGETVAAAFAAPTFVTLIDLNRLEVRAYVDETDIGRVRPGQAARFTVDTYGDQEFDGHVVAVYPQAEIRDNVVNYVTVIRFRPMADRIVRPEMTAAVRIFVGNRPDVVTVPIRAVRNGDGGTFVWVRRGDRFERRSVTTGLRDEDYCEIVDGLHPDDAVAVGDIKEGEMNPS